MPLDLQSPLRGKRRSIDCHTHSGLLVHDRADIMPTELYIFGIFMAILDIVTYPDDRLRVMTKPVELFDEIFLQFTSDMIETMFHDHGVGLAAPQVASEQRVFVMNPSRSDDTMLTIVANPEIIAQENIQLMDEACLSVPGIYAKVKRANKIQVRYQDANGKAQEKEYQGLAAQCFQHELDHLNGILFIDHLSPLKRKMAEKRLLKMGGRV